MGASAGRVLLIPKGDWNAETTYTGLDWVRYNGAAWVCKNTCTGIEPTEENSDNWQIMSRDGQSGSVINVDAAMSDTSENPVQNKVIKKYVDDHSTDVADMTGATADQNGTHGLVPAPQMGDEKKALLGDGTWGSVDAILTFKTKEEYDSAVANDEIPDGAKVIKEYDDGDSTVIIDVDTVMSDTSENPVQNKVVKSYVDNGLNTLKKSVSDGKTLVATAITDKGVETAADATFAVMAENIGQIETGGGELHGATISVTTTEETLIGKTITLSLNDTVVATRTFDDNGTCSFTDIQEAATYSLYSTDGADSATITVDITAENVVNKTVISCEFYLTPDGETITPVDDVAILLKCAEIKDKSYTTMDELLADEQAMGDITMSENAMKYLARSMGFADAVCANETFMTLLGASSYVDSTVLNSDLWVEKICNSQYMDKVLNDLVPAMASNTSSVGTAYVSPTDNSDYKERAYMMFDKDSTTCSGTATNSSYPHYYGMNFNSNKMICTISIPILGDNRYPPKDCILQVSDDGSNWRDIKQFIIDNTSGANNLIVFSQVSTKYIRIKANNGYYTNYNWSGIFEWYIYGR